MRPPRECHDNSYFFSSGDAYEKARSLLAKLGLGCGITTSRLGVAASYPSNCKPQWADHLSLTGAVRLVLTLGCALQHGAKMWRVGSHVCYEEGAPVRVLSRPAIDHQRCSCLLLFIVLELIPWDFQFVATTLRAKGLCQSCLHLSLLVRRSFRVATQLPLWLLPLCRPRMQSSLQDLRLSY
jgi:hypothetical protein